MPGPTSMRAFLRTPAGILTSVLVLVAALPAQMQAPSISRARFAAAYLRFETALRGVRLSPDEEVRVNRSFDGLTLLFFTGNLAKAMDSLNALTDSIDPQAPPAREADIEGRRIAGAGLRAEAASIRLRLEKLSPAKPGLAQALAAAMARADLLASPIDPENTAQALMDPAALMAQVRSEADALARGRNPYAGREGDYWRVFRAGERDVPVRVFAPPGGKPETMRPLIVALHGAGGDENMFMDGYGAGLIKTLARERGAVLATPRTGAFSGAGGAEAFDALLETLRTDYRIDPKRVFVLGHSMGGMATNALLASRGGKIAAGACLCGFQGFAEGTSGIPPVLIVAGEIDPIVSPARIEPAFRKAKAAGLPVEYRLIANYGHTLTVAKVLPNAVAWLFARSRS
jgi:predicted esterase